MGLSLYYCPCPEFETAEKISRQLLAYNLIACANIIPGMVSLYKWEGKIEESSEVILILKTQPENFTSIEKQVNELHPYDCPCILELNIENANSKYSSWVTKQLGGA